MHLQKWGSSASKETANNGKKNQLNLGHFGIFSKIHGTLAAKTESVLKNELHFLHLTMKIQAKSKPIHMYILKPAPYLSLP